MILLDLKDSRPIYEQVVERLQELMMLGILEEDSQMPSVRSLAMELSINPNTIQRAYGELERRGYTYSVKGRGSFVGSIRKLREAKKTELERRLGGLAREARTIGVLREEFVVIAGQAYDERPQNIKTQNRAGGIDEPCSMEKLNPSDPKGQSLKSPDIPDESCAGGEKSGDQLWVRNE